MIMEIFQFTYMKMVFTVNIYSPFIYEFFKEAKEKARLYMDYVFGNEPEQEQWIYSVSYLYIFAQVTHQHN
ncbi:adenosine kinase [Trifolium repens]|nr:adenosine kinase [Trifolium repens]